jgi:hypothetical protein
MAHAQTDRKTAAVGTGVKNRNKWMYGKCVTSTYLRDLGEKRNQRWKCYAVVFNEIFLCVCVFLAKF